jgi:hypothetical protein
MKIKEIIAALERFAPLPLQDGFDNAGLQVGLTEAEATGALLCLDVTEAVIDEAITLGYNLVVSHHPLIFKGFKSITGKDYVERCIMKAICHDIVIYSAHTNHERKTVILLEVSIQPPSYIFTLKYQNTSKKILSDFFTQDLLFIYNFFKTC